MLVVTRGTVTRREGNKKLDGYLKSILKPNLKSHRFCTLTKNNPYITVITLYLQITTHHTAYVILDAVYGAAVAVAAIMVVTLEVDVFIANPYSDYSYHIQAVQVRARALAFDLISTFLYNL